MGRRREPVYAAAIGAGRMLFGGVLRLRRTATGLEHLPSTGGAVLAITHFGYLDFALTEWLVWGATRRRIRFLARKQSFDHPLAGPLLRGMSHIPVDKASGAQAYAAAVAALQAGELVGVFPEAGVSASFTVRELKIGAVRMGAEAGVPVVPVVVWGGHLLRTKGRKTTLSEAYRAPVAFAVGDPLLSDSAGPDNTADPVLRTEELRKRMQSLLDQVQRDYPLPGAGRWWQPLHLGGAAPSPAVAAAAEAERQRRKALG